jgi:hypothetical protein
MEVAMAGEKDSDPGGGGKAHTFSLDELIELRRTLPAKAKHWSFQHFKEDMRAWRAKHAKARERDRRRDRRKPHSVLKARDGQRSALDKLLKGTNIVRLAMESLANYQPGPDRLVTELSAAHVDPSESLLCSRSIERAQHELDTILYGIQRLETAAAQARKQLGVRGHAQRETETYSALLHLGHIYYRMSGHRPGGTKKNDKYEGPWPKFGRLAALYTWGEHGQLTTHLEAVTAAIRKGDRSNRQSLISSNPSPSS